MQKELLVRAIARGDLSEARSVALEALMIHHAGGGCDETTLAKLYQQQADEMLLQQENHGRNDEQKIKYHHMNSTTNGRRVQAVVDDPLECWPSTLENGGAGGDNVMDLWDECCSQVTDVEQSAESDSAKDLPQQQGNDNTMLGGVDAHNQCAFEGKPLCCEFHVGSSSYLRLPALRELALRVRVESDDGVKEIYDLEQDGFLRRFDPAGILWPSGYLLALCVAAPNMCGVPELNDIAGSSTELFALELGSGIGLPSIALSRMLARRWGDKEERKTFRMVAADKARHALALIASNACAANASVSTVLMDHSNEKALATTFHAQTFSVILGSALQAFFDESTRVKGHPLWRALDQLLDRSEHAIVLLSHTTHSLQVPDDGNFVRMRKISGNQFGMKTRYGEDSDFLISVFRRVNSEAFDQEL